MPFEGRLALMSLLWVVIFGVASAACYEKELKIWKLFAWVAGINFFNLICALSIAIWRA